MAFVKLFEWLQTTVTVVVCSQNSFVGSLRTRNSNRALVELQFRVLPVRIEYQGSSLALSELSLNS